MFRRLVTLATAGAVTLATVGLALPSGHTDAAPIDNAGTWACAYIRVPTNGGVCINNPFPWAD
ncbi:MAG TPA: hypothetical protein VGA13_04485 [Acidimicrobiales bacterium]